MGMMVQFPSMALWRDILGGPPVSRDQGTRNPNGGFNDLMHAQLANQTAIAGLQPPPPRPPQLQRSRQKEAQNDARERDRNPRDPQQHPFDQGQRPPHDPSSSEQKPLIRAVWA